MGQTSSTFLIQMKTTAIQMVTCVNTMMQNKWNVHFFINIFQSFIYFFCLEVKGVSSWDYTRNCNLSGISFDVFGEIHNVLCNDFWILTWSLVVSSGIRNYLFWEKFHGRLDVIFHTLCFGSTKRSNYNMVFIVEVSW